MNTEGEVLCFAQDLQAGAKERICSDERVEDTVMHPTWQKSVKIYDKLGESATE